MRPWSLILDGGRRANARVNGGRVNHYANSGWRGPRWRGHWRGGPRQESGFVDIQPTTEILLGHPTRE